ncbi:MAG TPA: hypothetical protein PK329_05170 [Myxococcota bacterium]|nr:hypothetical protein [Myxococcota bacterium]HON24890.1 hypothetical protein [Myxococcota bacterium]HOS62394.1 hypothetical protein [Myxococcota bacterium]HPC92048.1 hypothetical protein [Myxococcota bacterium]HPL25450.1 hypothetical protein [Myxococcota bacterium]
MRQDSRLNKGGKIGFAVAFCSVAIFAISIAGCGSDADGTKAIEDVCSKLVTCSKLDQLAYTSYDDCISSNEDVWKQYDGCHDEIIEYLECLTGLACEDLTQAQAMLLCKDEVLSYRDCFLAAEGGDDDWIEDDMD